MTDKKQLDFSVHVFRDNNKLKIAGYVGQKPLRRERVRGQLSRMPGSPTIWVSHGLFVAKEYRGKGYSQAYNAFMLNYAWTQLDASAVIASVKQDNDIQANRLTQLGWRQISNAMWIVTPKEDNDNDSYSTLYDFYPPLNTTVD